MSTTVDTLVTKYVLDDKGYTQGANRVQASTGNMNATLGSLSGRMAGIATGAAVVGAAMLAMGQQASAVAARYEVMEKSLQVVAGSAGRAAEIFEFVKQQAAPSAFFGVGELGRAAQLLETFKLRAEEFLPVANTMASLFGQNEQSLNSFVMALGRIRSGSFGEGFERLREMGITREMLEAEGLSFNKSNQYTGDAEEALQAIKRAVEKSFGGLDAAMRETFQAQLASATDGLERSMGELGKGINEALLPSLKSFNEEIAKFNDSGRAASLGEMFGTFMESLQAAAQGIKDVIEILPFSPGKIADFIADKYLGVNMDAVNEMDKKTAEMQKDKRFRPAQGFSPETKKTKAEEETVEIQRTNTVFLGEIAKNTRETVNLQRIALGAGAGSLGITPVELSDMGRSRGGNRIAKAVEILVSAVQSEMIQAASDQSASRRQAFGRG